MTQNLPRKNRNNHESASERKDRIYRKIIEYGIIGLILFSPLPAASVYDWSILVIQSTVLVMVAAYILMEEKPRINSFLSQRLKWPKYLFFGFVFFILFQILPLPHSFIKVLSPQMYSFKNQFSYEIIETKFMSLSLAPSSTFREGLEILSYILLGFLIIRTITRKHQIRKILFYCVLMGLFEAFYGLFELYRQNPRILFYKKVENLGSVTGTFINQNHFSGYLEMIIPLAIGLVIARIEVFSSRKKWYEKIIRLAEREAAVNIILMAGIITMSLAIILAKSRSGFFLLFFLFFLFAGLSFLYFRRSQKNHSGVKSFLKITFLLTVLISLYIGVDATIERFAGDNLLQGGRPLYLRNVSTIIADYPLFGTGLGTFASVYPAYDKTETEGLLLHAHNDYLEYLSELGIIGFLFLISSILFLAVSSFSVWRQRRNPVAKGMALGGIVALIIIGIHSITDFNLHIPANMLLFSIILSLTIVSATYKKRENPSLPKKQEGKLSSSGFPPQRREEPLK